MIKVNFKIRAKCQNILRYSGQNTDQKLRRTKCQLTKKCGQNANISVGILSYHPGVDHNYIVSHHEFYIIIISKVLNVVGKNIQQKQTQILLMKLS